MPADTKATSRKFTVIAIIVFLVAGTFLFLLRHQLMSEDSAPAGDRIWQITISSQFKTQEASGTLAVGLPIETPRLKLVRQTFTHPTLTMKRVTRKEKSFSELNVSPQSEGHHTLTAELIVQSSNVTRWINKLPGQNILDVKQRTLYLEDSPPLNLAEPVLNETLNSIKTGVSDLSFLVNEIYQFVYEQVMAFDQEPSREVGQVLSSMRANTLDKTYTFIALCRASHIPARLVTGVLLEDAIDARLIHWAEVYDDDRWQFYDLEFGYRGEMPSNFMALSVNRETVARYNEPIDLDTSVDIEEIPAYAGLIGGAKKELIQLIDLTRLSLDTQTLLSTILLLPFGALITVFFRLVIGIRTFGTFTASLLALAMVFADWITVTFIVSVVAIISLAGLIYVAGQFSRVPRLAVVFTLVATSMAFGVSLMDYLNLNPSAGVILLPVVILTSLIDRIYTVTDEDGIEIMARRFVYTILVAFICFLVFRQAWLGQLIILHPEVHFFTLALILITSLYTGKMLSDLPIFNYLAEPEKPKKKTTQKKKSEATDERKHIGNTAEPHPSSQGKN